MFHLYFHNYAELWNTKNQRQVFFGQNVLCQAFHTKVKVIFKDMLFAVLIYMILLEKMSSACNFLEKGDSSTGVFLQILGNFQEHLFCRTRANGYFWIQLLRFCVLNFALFYYDLTHKAKFIDHFKILLDHLEAAVQRCSIKKCALKNFTKFTGNTYARVSLLIKLQGQGCSFIQKEFLAQVFLCEFCEIFKNALFYRTPPVTADNFHSNGPETVT